MELTTLQSACTENECIRDRSETNAVFCKLMDYLLSWELKKAYEKHFDSESQHIFTFAELCCGSGAATEENAMRLIGDLEFIPLDIMQAIAIDINPLPYKVTEEIKASVRDLLKEKGLEGERETIARYIKADIEKGIPLQDDSVDYIYCCEGINYIGDVLRTLEEIYRVLRPNGRAVLTSKPWFLAEEEDWRKQQENHYRSPSEFLQILAQTPNAEKIFRVVFEEIEYQASMGGGIIVDKIPKLQFDGFPFTLKETVPAVKLMPGSAEEFPLLKFAKSAVYVSRTAGGTK